MNNDLSLKFDGPTGPVMRSRKWLALLGMFLLVIVTASGYVTNSSDDTPVSPHRRLAAKTWQQRIAAKQKQLRAQKAQNLRKHRLAQAKLIKQKRSGSRGRTTFVKPQVRRVARKPVKSRTTSPRRVTPKRAVKNSQVETFFKHVKEGMSYARQCKYPAAFASYRKAQTQVNNYNENAKHKRSMQNKLDQLRSEAQKAQKVWKQMPNVPKTVTYADLDYKEMTLRYKIDKEWNALRKLGRSDYRRRSKFVVDLIEWGGTLQKLMGKALKHDCPHKSDIPLIKKRLAVYHQMKSTLDDSKRPEIKIP